MRCGRALRGLGAFLTLYACLAFTASGPSSHLQGGQKRGSFNRESGKLDGATRTTQRSLRERLVIPSAPLRWLRRGGKPPVEQGQPPLEHAVAHVAVERGQPPFEHAVADVAVTLRQPPFEPPAVADVASGAPE